MNCAYRLIWNDRFGAWCVVPEIASARGKRSGGVKQCAATLLITLALGSPIASAADLSATALPGGGQVAAGQAAISSIGAAMTINQGSQRAIINWQNFDIGSQASVSFQQPDASAVALNRVSGPTVSRIEGQLSANGQVFLVNPNGVLFGNGARVNVGGLVASTLNIRDADFLSGNYTFSGTGGSITNQGQITAAPGGYLAFIAPTITNNGSINAPQGTVAMGAGERVRLNFAGDRLVGLDVSASTIDALITNSQAIRAEGGAILLTAAGAEAVTRSVINNTGVLEASSLTSDGGRILLAAGNDINLGAGSLVAVDGKKGGEITVHARSGTLLAEGGISARGAESSGGTIQLLGNQVGLIAAAQVDASGTTGGGTVLVGGDYQGGNAAIRNAFRTYVGPQATIKADALHQGDGGKVIVWADDATRFAGTVSARGAAAGGDGGFVEISGKAALDFQGQVDTRAPLGKTGSLLLDPTDITISGAASTPTVVSGGNFSDPATTPSNLNVNTLVTQLGLSNVTVSTASGLVGNGDITVNNAINYNSANSLTLAANRNITVVAGSGGINNAGAGAVTLTGGGTGTIAVNENITTSGGAVALTSGSGGVTLAAAKSIDAGSSTVAITSSGVGAVNLGAGTLRSSNAGPAAISVTTATGAMTLGNVALTGGGSLSVNHGGAGSQTAGTTISGSGGLTKAGAGALALSQVNSYTGTTTVNAGALTVTGGNAIADTGAVVLTDAPGVSLNVNASETIGSLSGGGASGGNVTKSTAGAATLTVGRNGASTTFGGVVQNGSGTVSLVKEGTGTLTLTGANTYTGATGVSGGTLALSGATGAATGSTTFTINQGARLLLDNAAANNNNRIVGAVAMNGGELAITGNAAANTTEAIGALTFNSGYSTVTLTPDAARNTQVTFASLARTNNSGAVALFRGTNLGANTIASQTAGSSNIVFTAAPTLTGGGGNSGTSTVSIVSGAIGDASATGTGTDFVTYNPTGSANGLRPLLATEYASTPATNVNLKLTTSRTADDTFTINSLLLAGGVTYNFDNAAPANTLTVSSGNVLSLGAGNTLQPAQNTGTLAFGTAQPNFFAVGDLTLGSNLAVSGTRALGKSGAGTLLENRAVARTGGIFVNSGTLRSGVAGAFASQAVTVRAGGLFDLNGFASTVSGLTLESGATAGAAVTTGIGTLTLGGTATLNVNGTGATGATISGNLAETATRTYAVNDGVAADDLTIAAVISGAGGVTKTGNGTLALAGANTYTGITTISAGTLSANTLANGGVASSIGASGNAAGNLVIGNGATLQYTGGTASTNRNYTLNTGTTGGTIRVTNAAANLTVSGASAANAGRLTKAGAGTLTLSGANANTGLTTVNGGTLALGAINALATGDVTVTGGATFDIGTFSDSVGMVTLTNGNITGTTGTLTGTSYAVQNGTISAILGGAAGLTKTTAGTVTLSGANTYTGATTINGGVLSVSSLANGGSASNIGASTNAATNLVLGGGTLRYTGTTASTDRNVTLTAGTTSAIEVANPATNLTISGATTNTNGGLTKLGDGTLTLTGANANTGATTIRAGTLQVGNGGTTGSLGTGGVTNLGRLVFNRSNALTVANVVSSFGELVKEGAGTTTLTNANTYTGATTINAGTLALGTANERISNASAVTVAVGATFNLGGFSETIGSLAGAGTVINNGAAAATLTTGGNNTSTAFSGSLQNGTGTLALTKTGTGTFTLSGNNTYTGTTTISAGTLTASGGSAIADTSAVVLTNTAGATLNLANGETIGNLSGGGAAGGNVTLGANTLTVNETVATTYSGVISGTGGLTKTGAAALTLSGTNTYNGTTTISAGTLTAAGGSAIADASAVNLANVAGATLNLANNETIGNLSGGGATGGNVTLASNTLTVNQTAATTYAGSISGSGGLTKIGTDTLTLAGASSYTGVTNISAGTLAAASAAALGGTGGGTNVGSSGRLRIDGVAVGTEPVTLNGPGLFGTGAITSTGTASLAGPVTLVGNAVIAPDSGSTLTLSGPVNGAFGLTTGGGTLNLNGAVGGVTPLAFLTTGASGATGIGASVRTTGNQTYNSPTTLGTGAVLQSTGGNISLNEVVTASGAVSLQAAGDLLFQKSGSFGTLTATAGGTVTLGPAGQLAATGTGNAIVLSGSRFVNSAGAGALTATNGRWLVWSSNTNPFDGVTPDNRGGLAYNFKQYNATYPTTTVLGSGNGFLYAVAPVVTPVLAGIVTKVYDGNTTATLVPANLTASGTIDGDTVVFSASGATYDNRNVDINKTVTATGITATASNGTASVYGYTASSTTASANIGIITAAPLTVTAQTDNRVYNGTTSSAVAPVVSGATFDGVGTAATQTYDNRNVGTDKTLTASGLVMADGNGGNNYAISYVADTTGIITTAPLTVTAQSDNRVYNGTTSSAVAPVVSGTTYDSVGSAATQTYDNKNVGTGKTLTASGLVMADGNGGNNYAISYVADNTGIITAAPLVIAANNASKSFGAPNPPFSATYTGFVGGETASVLGGMLSFLTAAGLTSPPGHYAITPYGQTSSNYAIVFRDGVLNITGVQTGPGAVGATGADQQAIGAQYTSQGTPNLALTKVRFILAEDECNEATATSGSGCLDRQAEGSVVRLVDGGMLMPRQ